MSDIAKSKRVPATQRAFSSIANSVARHAGRPSIFVLALLIVIVWALTGPVFHYSDTWQLVINTGTTIVTFLMVFLIQNSQNRDSAAIQVNLDELIRVGPGKNFFVGIEHLTDLEIERLREMLEKHAKRGSALRVADEKADAAANHGLGCRPIPPPFVSTQIRVTGRNVLQVSASGRRARSAEPYEGSKVSPPALRTP